MVHSNGVPGGACSSRHHLEGGGGTKGVVNCGLLRLTRVPHSYPISVSQASLTCAAASLAPFSTASSARSRAASTVAASCDSVPLMPQDTKPEASKLFGVERFLHSQHGTGSPRAAYVRASAMSTSYSLQRGHTTVVCVARNAGATAGSSSIKERCSWCRNVNGQVPQAVI